VTRIVVVVVDGGTEVVVVVGRGRVVVGRAVVGTGTVGRGSVVSDVVGNVGNVAGGSVVVVSIDGAGAGGGAGAVETVDFRPRSSTEAVYRSAAGTPASAAFMYREKMRAGKLPPVTLIPWTPRIGVSPSGRPTHTAVDSWGVYPTNHADRLPFVVPVFPAAGRPSACAR
jgi:hypothetical protein